MKTEELLKKLILIPSVYPHEEEIQRYLLLILQDYGFTCSVQEIEPHRYNIFADNGKLGKAILFYGHMDTVQRTLPPSFPDGFVDGDKLYGLGSYDMKGGITAILQATKDAPSHVKIFLAVDEENISKGAWKAVEERKEFFSDVELIISAEPNFGNGMHSITTGRTGRYLYDIFFHGPSGHVIMDEKDTAMEKFLYFMNRNTYGNIRKIQADTTDMSICNQVYCQLESFQWKPTVLLLVLNEFHATATLAKRETPYLPSYTFSSFPHKTVIHEIIAKYTNEDMEIITRTSVGDDNVLATLGIPVITWGPDGDYAHRENEWVSISSIKTLSEMYKLLLNSTSK